MFSREKTDDPTPLKPPLIHSYLLKKKHTTKMFILPVLKRWPAERLIKDKMNKYIIMMNWKCL